MNIVSTIGPAPYFNSTHGIYEVSFVSCKPPSMHEKDAIATVCKIECLHATRWTEQAQDSIVNGVILRNA